MSVLFGLISREIARFSASYDSIIALEKPVGSEYRSYHGYNTPIGWNEMASALLASKHEWLFTMNDDHIYPANAVTKLIARQKECITGLYLLRQYPFEPVAYTYLDDMGRMGHKYLQPQEEGLIQIKVCGDGALLTHRSVFEKVPKWEAAGQSGWYQLNGPPAPLDQINCDVLYCERLRNHGVEIWCDLDVRVGHIACVPIFPVCKDGVWSTTLLQGNQMGIEVPAATPQMRPAMELEQRRLIEEAKAR